MWVSASWKCCFWKKFSFNKTIFGPGGTTSFFYPSFFFHPSFYFQVILPSFFKEKPSFFLSILPSFIMYTSFFFLFLCIQPSFFPYSLLFFIFNLIFYVFPSFLSKTRFSPQYFCPCSFHTPTQCTASDWTRGAVECHPQSYRKSRMNVNYNDPDHTLRAAEPRR